MDTIKRCILFLGLLGFVSQVWAKAEKPLAAKSKPTIKEITIATLIAPGGSTEELYSNDKKVLSNSPKIDQVELSEKTWMCKKSEENWLVSKQTEKGLELDFLIESLKGRDTLMDNEIKNLYSTQDCEQFRFQLHVIAKVQEGYKLKSITTKESKKGFWIFN